LRRSLLRLALDLRGTHLGIPKSPPMLFDARLDESPGVYVSERRWKPFGADVGFQIGRDLHLLGDREVAGSLSPETSKFIKALRCSQMSSLLILALRFDLLALGFILNTLGLILGFMLHRPGNGCPLALDPQELEVS